MRNCIHHKRGQLRVRRPLLAGQRRIRVTRQTWPMTQTHVAIAIVGYRNVGDIVRCLAALTMSSHTHFEVVICENGGLAACADLVEALPARLSGGQEITIIEAPCNLGYAGGVNVCRSYTPTADAWWLLNPDTRPEPEALAALLERLGQEDCDAVGATLLWPDRIVQSYGGRWRSWLARAESIGLGHSLGTPVDLAKLERSLSFLSGASLLFGRRFHDIAGVMREDYFLYCEEVEWCLRAKARGMRLGFAPNALVVHDLGTTTGAGDEFTKRPRLPLYLGERNRLLVTRDCFPARLHLVAIAAFLLLVVTCIRHRAWRQLGYSLEGWWAGLLNRRGTPSWLPSEPKASLADRTERPLQKRHGVR